MNWGPVVPNSNWQIERELLTILAGPVAEAIYRGEPLHPAVFPPWRYDWEQALIRCAKMVSEKKKCVRLLEKLYATLHQRMSEDECWAAVAAVADELLAHEYLEREQILATLQFWIG